MCVCVCVSACLNAYIKVFASISNSSCLGGILSEEHYSVLQSKNIPMAVCHGMPSNLTGDQ